MITIYSNCITYLYYQLFGFSHIEESGQAFSDRSRAGPFKENKDTPTLAGCGKIKDVSIAWPSLTKTSMDD